MAEDIQKCIFSLVVPVLNEEDVLKEFYKRITSVMTTIGENYEIIFVNDGSTDSSLEIMMEFCKKDTRIKIIDFSRNFGHQIAITAGIEYASGEAVIIIDADLQDPPEVIPQFITKWREGHDVIYGIREIRKGEKFSKKFTAKIFYRLLSKMISINIPTDTGDFRLLDKKVVKNLKQLKEKNRYLRGLTSWVGFNQTGVSYKREKRHAGSTKFSFRKMLKFAVDAIVSFTNIPLRLATFFWIYCSWF